MSHYTFRQHHINKCNKYSCHCIIVTEEYTLLTYCNCGHMSSIYNNRIKSCINCNKIRNKINELKMGQLLTGNNNRNIKNIELINGRKHKLSRSIERLLLKTRINIEHIINEYQT